LIASGSKRSTRSSIISTAHEIAEVAKTSRKTVQKRLDKARQAVLSL